MLTRAGPCPRGHSVCPETSVVTAQRGCSRQRLHKLTAADGGPGCQQGQGQEPRVRLSQMAPERGVAFEQRPERVQK